MTFPAAVVFDHDGTLIDSPPLVVAATNRVLHEHGYRTLPAEMVIDGMRWPTAPRLARAAGLDHDDPRGETMAQAFYSAAREMAPGPSRAYPGIRDLLRDLHQAGLRLGLLSNNEGVLVRRLCAHHGLSPWLSIIFGEEDVPAPKPDPVGLQRMADCLGVSMAELIYVGDSETDLNLARAAGCRAWGVSWGAHPASELQALGFDRLFHAVEELAAALR